RTSRRRTATSSSTMDTRRPPTSAPSSSWRGAACAIGSASSCGTRSSCWESSEMSKLVIRGGRRLEGRVAVEGNKNAALPLLAACLLTGETCELNNVPRIRDVAVMTDLLTSLGAEVEGQGTTQLRVTCRQVHGSQPDPRLVGRLRGSVLLLGSLLARTGRAELAPP